MTPNDPAEECKKGAPEWMVTFADMMSLLLTFFVLLLSFSNIEVVKFMTMAGSIRGAFGLRSELDLSNTPMGSQFLPKPAPSYQRQPTPKNNVETAVKLRAALEQTELKDSAQVEVTDRGVTLRIPGDAAFESGKTDLSAAALELLQKVADVASSSAGTIEVEGHTDDVPIRTAHFPSNWELSAARAGAAVRYLTARGMPSSRLKAIGYADTRPLAPNDSAENRSKNRRIEVLFVTQESADAPGSASSA